MIPIWVGGINVHKCAMTRRTTRIVASMLLMFPCVKLLCVSYLTTNVEIYPFLHGCCLFEEFRWFQELDKIASFRFQENKNHNFHIVILQKSPFPSTFSNKSHHLARHGTSRRSDKRSRPSAPKASASKINQSTRWLWTMGTSSNMFSLFFGGIWPTSSKPALSTLGVLNPY